MQRTAKFICCLTISATQAFHHDPAQNTPNRMLGSPPKNYGCIHGYIARFRARQQKRKAIAGAKRQQEERARTKPGRRQKAYKKGRKKFQDGVQQTKTLHTIKEENSSEEAHEAARKEFHQGVQKSKTLHTIDEEYNYP